MKNLLRWYKDFGRHDLPWRNTRDPYKILVSELMLQQTQVTRVIPKYKIFLQSFPTLQKLAAASRKEVLQHWQGLGYNSRAIRLHELAKTCGGMLPCTYEELLTLPGIGPYTAGAVMIFAYDVPAHSVDVNIDRIIRRFHWGVKQRPSAKDVQTKYFNILQAADSPHEWHSAMMDLGSSICIAKNPKCSVCPLKKECKTQGMHPSEVQKKQATFKDSNRWYRGKILKAVLSGTHNKKKLLAALGGGPKAENALAELEKEGLVRVQNTRVIVE